MAEWGAPIYRVENRIITAAKALEIPISFFSLPSMIMVNIGDGGAQHPSRTVFIQLSSSMNMWKLHQADRLARRLGLIYIRFEKLKMRVLSKHEKKTLCMNMTIMLGCLSMHFHHLSYKRIHYGATFGSRFAVTVLQTFEAWAIDDTLKACPSPDLPLQLIFGVFRHLSL
ncbi:hypothetical protein BSLG_005954 [Batrachochytrium salamandrivorans]|nr:hypothetical protein BSLG_005954 [Batrachochytrium salamandrivorans]